MPSREPAIADEARVAPAPLDGAAPLPRRARPASPPLSALAVALLLLALALSACGGGSKGSGSSNTAQAHTSATAASQASTTTTQPGPAATPVPSSSVPSSTIVARVQGKTITLGQVRTLMGSASAPEALPDAPGYVQCAAAAKAKAEHAGLSPQPSEAELKQKCQKTYEGLFSASVSKAIHTLWLQGEARERGISLSPEAVLREFDQAKKSFKSNAEFESYRQKAHLSIAQMLDEVKINKIGDALFALIKAKQHPASPADVAAYYASHRKDFLIPEGRDVRIVRTTTKAGAESAMRELRSGKSFAQVASHLTQIGQPIGAAKGEVKDLKPGVYEEKSLNDPIFTAKLHRLYGPLDIIAAHKTIAPETNSGYFIFEVTATVPARQTPLSAVKATLAAKLTEKQKYQVLGGFIAAFRRKWTARTDCQAGYVVRNCKQFKKAGASEAEDPYTL